MMYLSKCLWTKLQGKDQGPELQYLLKVKEDLS